MCWHAARYSCMALQSVRMCKPACRVALMTCVQRAMNLLGACGALVTHMPPFILLTL